MRETATKKNNKIVLGTAEKFPEKMKPFTSIQYDFLVTFAQDEWDNLTPAQRCALVDHELCHLEYDENSTPLLRGHDVEEFAEIIQRHGLWQPELREMALEMVQYRFEFSEEEAGVIGTVEYDPR